MLKKSGAFFSGDLFSEVILSCFACLIICDIALITMLEIGIDMYMIATD